MNFTLLKMGKFPVRCFSTAKLAIEDIVKESTVVVFMKGVPDQPRCGFSNAVVQILRTHGVKFIAHDVLRDNDLREDVKNFSHWPTIPQVFINGEFVGGSDILLEMHRTGKLTQELMKHGITSKTLQVDDTI